jgi:monofunctional biosynthetic peptidoglycan transglycosylase
MMLDFSTVNPSEWILVNDDVMGGRSTSQLTVTDDGTGIFSGFISLENNGGFASTRVSLDSLDLSEHEGVVIRVRGDGRRYQLRFRTEAGSRGLAYKAEFETAAGEWQETVLPFREFQATFRGHNPPDTPPLRPGQIRQVGFLIADKIEGPFRLEVDWIKRTPS